MIFRICVIGGQTSTNPDNIYVYLNADTKLEAIDKIQTISGILWQNRDDYRFMDIFSEEELAEIAFDANAFQNSHLVEMESIDVGIAYITDALILLVGSDRIRLKIALQKGFEKMDGHVAC